MKARTEFLCRHGKLRPVNDADLEDLRRWRNHPKVRRAMITRHEIPPQEHAAWWEKTCNDDAKRWYIYTETGEPSAVVGFFRLDWNRRTGWWGFYLCDYSDESSAGRRELAQRIVETAVEHAFKELNLRLLLCEVFESNAAAVRLYRQRGFVESEVSPSKAGIGLVVLELKNAAA